MGGEKREGRPSKRERERERKAEERRGGECPCSFPLLGGRVSERCGVALLLPLPSHEHRYSARLIQAAESNFT